MIDVTKYFKKEGLNPKETVRQFLRMSRVKYIIASDDKLKVIRTSGRYGGTKMSDKLFELFKYWLDKNPIPMLNRKEFEVSNFINTYFNKKVLCQAKFGKYFADWFVSDYNLIIEFYEKEHNYKKISDKHRISYLLEKHNVFIIKENSVMEDLARLSIEYRPL